MQPLNPSANRRLTTLDGTPASCLGLAAGPKQDPRCVRRAFAGGINYFFFYGAGNTSFIEELATLVPRKREQIILATGSGSRRVAGLRAARRNLIALLGTGLIDVFFIEYVHPGDNPDVMFGKNGVLDDWAQRVGRDPGAIERTISVFSEEPLLPLADYAAAGVEHVIRSVRDPFDLTDVSDLLAQRDRPGAQA